MLADFEKLANSRCQQSDPLAAPSLRLKGASSVEALAALYVWCSMNISRLRHMLGFGENWSKEFDNSPPEIAAQLCLHLVDVGCSQMILGIDPKGWSSARVAIAHLSRVQDFIIKVFPTNSRKYVRDPILEARDKWIYRLCCKRVEYSKIKIKLDKKPERWPRLDITGIRNAAIKYAKRHNLPPIPQRQTGRRPAK